LPRCVRGWEWPPRRDTLDKSSLKRCCSQSTYADENAQQRRSLHELLKRHASASRAARTHRGPGVERQHVRQRRRVRRRARGAHASGGAQRVVLKYLRRVLDAQRHLRLRQRACERRGKSSERSGSARWRAKSAAIRSASVTRVRARRRPRAMRLRCCAFSSPLRLLATAHALLP
jgi:hypothetical protein